VVPAGSSDPTRDALGVPAAVVPHLVADHPVYLRGAVGEIDVEPMGAPEAGVEHDTEGTSLPHGGDVQINARACEQTALVDDSNLARVLLGEKDPLGAFNPGHVNGKVEARLIGADGRAAGQGRSRNRHPLKGESGEHHSRRHSSNFSHRGPTSVAG
jgi:hypothetical protein